METKIIKAWAWDGNRTVPGQNGGSDENSPPRDSGGQNGKPGDSGEEKMTRAWPAGLLCMEPEQFDERKAAF